MSVGVLFVGGPWDGRRVMLRAASPRFFVQEPQFPLAGFSEPEEKVATIKVRSFEYHRAQLPSDAVIYVPADWYTEPFGQPADVLIRWLVRGYTGGSL